MSFFCAKKQVPICQDDWTCSYRSCPGQAWDFCRAGCGREKLTDRHHKIILHRRQRVMGLSIGQYPGRDCPPAQGPKDRRGCSGLYRDDRKTGWDSSDHAIKAARRGYRKEDCREDMSCNPEKGRCMKYCHEFHQNRNLTIRKMDEQDFEPLHVLLSNPEVMRFLEPPYAKEQTRAFLRTALSEVPPVYAVDLDGAFIGYVIYHAYEEDSMEIGWVLTPEQWGKGYASALTEQMIARARKEGKSLVIECDPGQERTKHIAVRYGFAGFGTENGLEIYRLSSSFPDGDKL